MIDDLTDLSAAFVAQAFKVAYANKPDATRFEVEGLTYRILVSALDNYEQARSSKEQSQEGIGTQSEQIQRTGFEGRVEESPEGIRNQQESLTRSGKKKRRGSKSQVGSKKG